MSRRAEPPSAVLLAAQLNVMRLRAEVNKMRIFIFAVAIGLVPVCGWAEGSLFKVTFVRDNKPVALTENLQQISSTEILSTLEATGHDSSSYAASKEVWQKLASGSYLILSFSAPTEVVGFWKRTVLATEVLIPVSQDDHYLVRNAGSGEYWAFTKMIPERRVKLICRKEFLVEKNKSFCELMLNSGKKDA